MLSLTEMVGKRYLHLSLIWIALSGSNSFEMGRYRSHYFAFHLKSNFGNTKVLGKQRANYFNMVSNNKHSGGIHGGRNLLQHLGDGGSTVTSVHQVDWGHLQL